MTMPVTFSDILYFFYHFQFSANYICFVFVLNSCRDKSPLASYFVACCDLTEQLSSRKYVDVYRTVLELKRTPMGDAITLV